ncbi:polyprenyl synthetase family protein [Sulfodiicoccus acidiphilus]
MLSVLEGRGPLYEAARHTLLGGGKRLRPLILVAVSDILGGEREKALYAGASVEVLHSFTLVHDDIMDQDQLRRGKPTVHVLWGVPMAILAGDLLHVKSYQLIQMALRGKSSETVLRALDTLTRAVVVISEGQAKDMEFESRSDVTEAEYIDMISKKTAELFATSAELGGVLAEADEDKLRKLREYGINLGIAFQIADDILGLTGDEKELGKPVFSDIREGKKTILVIKALHEGSERQRKIILTALGNRSSSRDELAAAANVLRDLSLNYALKLAEEYSNKSLSALDSLNIASGPQAQFLRDLATLVVRRRK